MGHCALVPDITISGRVPASICTEPDVDLQLHAGSTYDEDDLAGASDPACHRVGYLHVCCLYQMKCLMRRTRFLRTTYVSKHRDTSVADSAADGSLLGLVHRGCICHEVIPANSEESSQA